MKRSFLLIGLALSTAFFVQTKLYSQCTNLNFSQGNFSNWQAYKGTWSSIGDNISTCPITSGRYEIMSTDLILTNQFYDEYCPLIPKVPNGFSYAAKLGNANPGNEVNALEYTMTVDSNNSLLIVHFAFVLQTTGHSSAEQPRFSMILKDSLGNEMPSIPCSKLVFPAASGDSNLACDVPGISGFVARDWTTVAFSLEPYIGRTIKIYFETRNCALGCHFGYAYLVAECRPMRIELQLCPGATVARMSAPVGFIKYRWTRKLNPSWFKEGGIEMRQIVEPNVQEGDIYTCEMTSALGSSCSAQVKIEIKRTSVIAAFYYGVKNVSGYVDFTPKWQNWYDTCARTATFVEFVTVNNSTKAAILWEIMDPKDKSGKSVLATSTDSMFTYTFPDPDSTPVTYRVRLTGIAENGCTDTNHVVQTITIYPSPRVKIAGESELCDTAWLKAVAVRSKFVHHTWTDKNGTQIGTGDSIKISAPGTYILASVDTSGCIARDTFKVTYLQVHFNNLSITNVSCYGDATGWFTHDTIIGGTHPYTTLYWRFKDMNGNDSIVVPPNDLFGMYSNLKAGIYRFEAIDANGCPLSGDVEIRQFDLLKLATTSQASICNLNNGILSLGATGGLPPYKYKVEKEDGTLVSVPHAGTTISNLAAGKYKITITDVNNCVTSDTISIADKTISLTAIYLMEGDIRININQDTTMHVAFNPTNACNKNIVWYSQDTSIATVDANGIVKGISYGRTYVVATADDGGSQASRKITVSNVGINSFTKTDKNIKVYPNPTTGQLIIDNGQLTIAPLSPPEGGKQPTIEIYDVVGQVVFTSPLSNLSPETTIDISHLANGLYFLKVDGKVVKIVKE